MSDGPDPPVEQTSWLSNRFGNDHSPDGRERILCISCAGIGNTILFTPALVALHAARPDLAVDLLTWTRAAAECVIGSDLIDRADWFPRNTVGKILKIKQLRARRYRRTLVPIPSNRWPYHVLPFVLGARERVCHGYEFGRIRSLAFLSNRKVMAIEGLHDVENNLRLLEPLEIAADPAQARLVFKLDAASRAAVATWWQSTGLSKASNVMGVHAGAGPIGPRKQWGLGNFAGEIRRYLDDDNRAAVVLFGGPEERAEREELRAKAGHEQVHIFCGSLKETAAAIERCSSFLSNDTGLMHVAAALGIPQRAVFVATSVARTRPWNDRAEVLDLTEGRDFPYPFRACAP